MRVALALLVACVPLAEPDPPAAGLAPYPLDDVLRLHHLQALGTHNSYHVETTPLDAWAYTHAPLDVQLAEQGVRQFELDLYWSDEAQGFEVLHIPFLDAGTTCLAFADCLAALADGSRARPGHHPFVVLLELKDAFDPQVASDRLARLEADVLAAFDDDALLTPDLVQGEHDNLRDALAADGWPTLGETRARGLFVLHAGGAWRAAYTDDLATTRGRPLFPDAYGDLTLPIAAFHSLNDPFDVRIAGVVDAGHLVRTRADTDTHEARTLDTSRRDRALASGAHFISTDFPVPVAWTEYVVTIPDGTPSRCNPRTAPAPCTPDAIERDE